MYKSAEDKYDFAVWRVLNRIKEQLQFDPQEERVVAYLLDLNIKHHSGVGLVAERKIIEKLINEGLITSISDSDFVSIGEPQTPEYKAYELFHFKVKRGFEDYYDQYQKKQRVDLGFCWFDNNTFFLRLRDGSAKPIAFDTERGNRNMLVVFQVLIDHWKRNDNLPIGKGEITIRAKSYGVKIEPAQLKNIMSNIRKTKLKPAELEDIISIDFDRKTGGWSLTIAR